MSIFDNASNMKTALDMVNVARKFVEVVDEIHAANKEVQERAKTANIGVELQASLVRLDKAVSKILY